jgi:DAK2 domain fusion protein YloV
VTNPSPLHIWHGQELAAALRHASTWLDAHREEVNALNVFPVPDGDTGTNMAMTMQSATANLPGGDSTVAQVAQLVTRGALLGARGNSGVILSQIFRGFSEAIAARDEIDGRDLAAAIAGARDMAYKAVMRPVEGTMLTVISGAADGAAGAARRNVALDTVLMAAIEGANTALASTPDLLPILKQAGVVDAGGRGVVLILEGMLRFNRGETAIPSTVETPASTGAMMAFLDQPEDLHGDDPYGYCTNFLVVGNGIDFDVARDTFAAMGQSAVIVGDESMVKVHIHTEQPGQVLDYALTLGLLDQIKIDNMTLQTESLTAQRATATIPPPSVSADVAGPVIGTIGIVAVAAGEGMADALRAMGATVVISGGQTMNPSTEDLLRAVESVPAAEVIVLPNNRNIIMAANQLPSLTGRGVSVVPSSSVPQGLMALSSFNSTQSLAENVTRMSEEMTAVTTIEVTRAVRDVEIDGLCVSAGQVIALVNDVLTAAGPDVADVLSTALSGINPTTAELVTLFTGIDATREETAAIEAVFSHALPDAEVDTQEGGQPHYLFVIGVE